MAKKRIVSRKWFNKPDTEYTSFILWSVEFPQKSKSYNDEYAYARLKLGDCNRSIEFALDMEDKNIKGTINKLDILVAEVTKLKETILEAYNLQFEMLKEKATKEKEKDARKDSKKAKKAGS